MDFDSPSRVRQAAWGEGNYIVEYAKSGRSVSKKLFLKLLQILIDRLNKACKGKKPCTGTKILAGDLRCEFSTASRRERVQYNILLTRLFELVGVAVMYENGESFAFRHWVSHWRTSRGGLEFRI